MRFLFFLTFLILFISTEAEANPQCLEPDAERKAESVHSHERLIVRLKNRCDFEVNVVVCIERNDNSWYRGVGRLKPYKSDWWEVYKPSKEGRYQYHWQSTTGRQQYIQCNS